MEIINGLLISLLQVVKMLFAVVVIFTLSVSPSVLFDFWYSMTEIFSKVDVTARAKTLEWIRNGLSIIAFINSSVNALIYYWTSE